MRFGRKSTVLLLSLIVLFAAAATALAGASQEKAGAPRVFTAADYAQAEKFMTSTVANLVLRSGVRPNWLARDAFWYRNAIENDGSEFVLVDPAKKGKRAPAFDHAAVAAVLSKAAGKIWDAAHLPFQTFEFSADRKSILFQADEKRWSCDVAVKACKPVEGGTAPDGAGERAARAAVSAAASTSPRPTASSPSSSATTTCGSARSRRAPSGR